MSAKLDAVTLEVLWTRIISVVDEAAKAIVRTSFSTLSNEANDFACMLTDARGYALAQNSGSIPSFIGTLPATVRHFLREMGAERMQPGDVLVTNDAWMGTGHMSDVSVLAPIFHRGRLVAFSATTSHMPDIGGRIRAIEAREIFEEGLHIPLTKLVHAGRVDDTLVALVRANVRTPDQTMGDIWAQVSANELMGRRVTALVDDYGLDGLTALGDELFARSEGAMREAIRAVPDGTYRDGFRTDGTGAPFEFRIALTVAGDAIVADYTGTSPQQPRAINCVMAYTYAMTAYAVRCALLPGLPNNEGMYRPIEVVAPEGSLLNPRFPAAVVSRATTGHYVPALVLGALHHVIPERVMAGAGSPLWALSQSSTREDGKPYTTVLFFNGGMGATPVKDGECVLSWPSNISSTPVEVAERNSPLFFHYKRLRPGSGGRGRFRGGLGQDILIESRSARPIVLSVMAERTRFPAPGLAGGAAGGRGDVRINGRRIDNRKQHVLERGDRVLVSTPGGGGYGPPRARNRALSERDRALGYVTGLAGRRPSRKRGVRPS
ncbi:MAG: hydantoinase B/oxoprolinase family protein [Candidatus Rokuibacteriota bacterium]